MKFYQFFLAFFFLISTANIGVTQTNNAEPVKYRMEQVYIFEDDKPTEYIFVLNSSIGFKSVKTLKKFIGKLPPGTIIEWQLSCEVLGDEPLRSSEKEMSDFKEFCERQKIKFILGIAG